MTNTGVAAAQLKSVVERIERLEEEKKAIADDIKEVYAEAKANGFDTKTLRDVIRLRKQDANERAEREALLDTYLHALGMLADTPLGQASIEKAVSARVKKAAANPRVRKAFKALGTSVELTEEEKAKGYSAAFVDGKGTRMAIGAGKK